jgi:hypothetical protein
LNPCTKAFENSIKRFQCKLLFTLPRQLRASSPMREVRKFFLNTFVLRITILLAQHAVEDGKHRCHTYVKDESCENPFDLLQLSSRAIPKDLKHCTCQQLELNKLFSSLIKTLFSFHLQQSLELSGE